MSRTVLDRISFEADLERLLERARERGQRRNVEGVERLRDEALKIGVPRALYRPAYIDDKGDDFVVVDGVKLTSRVLRVNLDEAHRLFVFVVTCGPELDAWAGSFGDLLDRYWADKISETAAHAAMRALRQHLVERFQLGRISVMSPGSLEYWPIEQQRELFRILGDTEGTIGVRLTDSCLMLPTKSISGLLFPTEVSFESCQLCPRENCPGRRAEYDQGLYARKYERTGHYDG